MNYGVINGETVMLCILSMHIMVVSEHYVLSKCSARRVEGHT